MGLEEKLQPRIDFFFFDSPVTAVNFSPENLGFLGVGKANCTNFFSLKVGKKWGGVVINGKIIDYQSYSGLLIEGITLGRRLLKKQILGSFAFMCCSRDW